MRHPIMLKSLPCFLALSGVSASIDRPFGRFAYELDDLIRNHDVRLDWHFKDENRLQFKFFCYVTDENNTTSYYGYEQAYDLRYSGTKSYDGTFTIPKKYTNVEKLHLYFGLASTTTDNWSDIVYEHRDLGSPLIKHGVSGTKRILTNRYRVESGLTDVKTYNYRYDVKYNAPSEDNFSLGIERWTIRYRDTNAKSYPIRCNAELRILDHIKDFGIGKNVGGDYGYLSIPLALEDNENDGTYSIYTKAYYVYSKITGEMANYSTKPNTTYIKTRNVFANELACAGETIEYQIWLTDINGIDEIVLERSVSFSESQFGNCREADYCVVIGEE